MTSTLGWLDASPGEQRRVQEIVRMFSQSETTDELGGRQVFVVLSDVLFPGTSVLQSRARYLLFVPWLCRRASTKGKPAGALDRMERELIKAFLDDDTVDETDRLSGLIGRAAGPQVKQLPSTAYWSGLTAWGILQRSGTKSDVLRWTADDRSNTSDADELAERRNVTWHPGIGSAPPDFPDVNIDGGFALSRSEAVWLRERWLDTAPGSMLAHLASATQPLAGTAAPWLEPLCLGASPEMVSALEDAERFSLAIEGAQWMYHLLVSEAYVAKGYTQAPADIDAARDGLSAWATKASQRQRLFDVWSSAGFWAFVRGRNPRINELTRSFFDVWFLALAEGPTAAIADHPNLRKLVTEREVMLKKPPQSRLRNSKMLAAWKATRPAPTVYRWPQVQQLVNDVHAGLGIGGDDVRA